MGGNFSDQVRPPTILRVRSGCPHPAILNLLENREPAEIGIRIHHPPVRRRPPSPLLGIQKARNGASHRMTEPNTSMRDTHCRISGCARSSVRFAVTQANRQIQDSRCPFHNVVRQECRRGADHGFSFTFRCLESQDVGHQLAHLKTLLQDPHE